MSVKSHTYLHRFGQWVKADGASDIVRKRCINVVKGFARGFGFHEAVYGDKSNR